MRQPEHASESHLKRLELLEMFSHVTRAGDGSDPFRRYQYCFNEYNKAIQNIVDAEGNSKAEINIHALDCCLQTYIRNMNVILTLLSEMKKLLQQGKDLFLEKLKKGHLPSYTQFKNMTFKN